MKVSPHLECDRTYNRPVAITPTHWGYSLHCSSATSPMIASKYMKCQFGCCWHRDDRSNRLAGTSSLYLPTDIPNFILGWLPSMCTSPIRQVIPSMLATSKYLTRSMNFTGAKQCSSQFYSNIPYRSTPMYKHQSIHYVF